MDLKSQLGLCFMNKDEVTDGDRSRKACQQKSLSLYYRLLSVLVHSSVCLSTHVCMHIDVSWLASEPRDLPVSAFFIPGLQAQATVSGFYVMVGMEFKSSCLYTQAPYPQSHLLSPLVSLNIQGAGPYETVFCQLRFGIIFQWCSKSH